MASPGGASDRYRILAEHGRGGLGRVSRALDRDLDREVAIKELIQRSHISEMRFYREALITARLEHPNIVPVHEAGRWPDGTPFYAMKLVAGKPLRDLIAERETVEARLTLLHHVIAVADAIAYAHGRNIIHRDLKPGNVIVGDFGETIVIDWGLAKDLTTTADEVEVTAAPGPGPRSDLTSTGSVLGTPTYMAPEQARGEHVDQRADVFAIGAMLWELCSLEQVAPTARSERHALLRRASIDPDLIAIIDKALEHDPAKRYRDAAPLAADLKAFKSGARIAARDYTLLGRLSHWMRRHRAVTLGAAVALLAAASGVAVYLHSVEAAAQALTVEHDALILDHAELQLTRDPAAALDTLDTYHGDHRDRANQLRAEAVGRGAAILRATPHTDNVMWARGSKDGSIVSFSVDGTIVRTRAGQPPTILARDVSAKLTWAYSDRRHVLAYSCNGTRICLLDITTDARDSFDLGADGTQVRLSFSPSGNHLATIAQDGRLRAFDVTQPNNPEIFSTKTTGSYVLAAGESMYMIGDPQGWGRVAPNLPTRSLPSPDGNDWAVDETGARFAFSTKSGKIWVMDTTTLQPIADQIVCGSSAVRVQFIPQRPSLVYACSDGQLGVWNPSETHTTKLVQLKGSPLLVQVAPTGDYIVAADHDLTIDVIDLQTGLVAAYQGERYRTNTVTAPTADYPFIISADAYGNLRVWPLPRRAAKLAAHVDGRFTSAVMQQDKLVAMTRNKQVAIYDPGHGLTTRAATYPDDWFIERAASSGQLVTYGFSNKARLWTDPELHHAIEIDTGSAAIVQLKALATGDWLSADAVGHVVRWSAQTAATPIDDRHQAITSLVVAADRHTAIAATIDGALWEIDLTAAQPARPLRGPGPRITAMGLVPDGAAVVLGQADGDVTTIRLDDNHTRTWLHAASTIRDIVFARDGRAIAVATSRDQVYLGAWSDRGDADIAWSELAAEARHITFTAQRELLIECSNSALWVYSLDDRDWDFVPLGTGTPFALVTTGDDRTAFVLDIDGNILSIDLDKLRQQRKHKGSHEQAEESRSSP